MVLAPIVAISIAAAILLVTLVLLGWSAAARRGANPGPETVLFARSPWQLLVGAVAAAGCVAGLGFVDTQQNSGVFVALVLVGLFALAFAGQFLASALVFWVADHIGLTRQVLAYKTTVPWHAIDWIYPAQQTTTYRTYGVKTGQSTIQSLMIEAGPNTKLKLTVRAWLVGGEPRPLVEAIQQRATDALFGYDKFQAVRQRRAAIGAR